MNALKGFVSLIGRVVLVAIFLSSTIMFMIPQFETAVKMMKDEGMPEPRNMLFGAIAFLIVGSICVILGCWARFGAFLLLVFLALAAYYFHDFWTMQGEKAQNEMAHFMKNVSMAGAMLFIIANGPGAWSIDQCRASRKLPAPP